MARIRKTPIHSVSLSHDTEAILQQLSSEASDYIGRAISESAIIRALLRRVQEQGPPAADALFVQVEKELKGGVRWGKSQARHKLSLASQGRESP